MFHQLFSTKLDSSAPISSKQAVKTQETFVSAQFLIFCSLRPRLLLWTMPASTTHSMRKKPDRVLTRWTTLLLCTRDKGFIAVLSAGVSWCNFWRYCFSESLQLNVSHYTTLSPFLIFHLIITHHWNLKFCKTWVLEPSSGHKLAYTFCMIA